MVESKPKHRSRSSSSSSSSSSSGSSSASASSSTSSSSASRSPTPKKNRTTTGRSERSAAHRRSPRRNARSRSRSPRRVAQPKSEKMTVSSSRRSPSPATRRRQASPPPRHRSRSPIQRRSPVRRDRERQPVSPQRERRERTPELQSKRVCARNLSRNITKAHLEEIFSLFGMIKSCELPMDRIHTHIPRGYGYVEYEKAEDAEKAIKHMDGGQIDGLEIQCELTLPYRPGRGSSPHGAFGSSFGGTKRERSRSPRRVSGTTRGGVSPPARRPRRSRSPPSRSTGANSIPLGNGGGSGRYRSPPRR